LPNRIYAPFVTQFATQSRRRLLYAAATLYQGTRLAQGAKADTRLLAGLGVLALLAHAASLFTHLMTPVGLGLDFSAPPA